MNSIERTYTIKAPVENVWWALTTVEGGEAWGAGPVKFEATEGGEFSYWDGDIHGINTKVVPNELLEQDWYGHDDPSAKFRAIFSFKSVDEGTQVHLTFSGDIKDAEKDTKDWDEYYFAPIKTTLEAE